MPVSESRAPAAADAGRSARAVRRRQGSRQGVVLLRQATACRQAGRPKPTATTATTVPPRRLPPTPQGLAGDGQRAARHGGPQQQQQRRGGAPGGQVEHQAGRRVGAQRGVDPLVAERRELAARSALAQEASQRGGAQARRRQAAEQRGQQAGRGEARREGGGPGGRGGHHGDRLRAQGGGGVEGWGVKAEAGQGPRGAQAAQGRHWVVHAAACWAAGHPPAQRAPRPPRSTAARRPGPAAAAGPRLMLPRLLLLLVLLASWGLLRPAARLPAAAAAAAAAARALRLCRQARLRGASGSSCFRAALWRTLAWFLGAITASGARFIGVGELPMAAITCSRASPQASCRARMRRNCVPERRSEARQRANEPVDGAGPRVHLAGGRG
jgi:hypothetical protein